VLIAYDEELVVGKRSALQYRLPLAFQRAIEAFSIHIAVIRSSAPPVFEENLDDELRFDNWQDTWSASKEWVNYEAKRSLTIQVPKFPEASEVMMRSVGNQYFYLINTFPQSRKIAKTLPARITILWDASLSGLSRNVEKEAQLLDAYFSKLRQVDVTLVNFSNAVQSPQTFSVNDGHWEQLRSALKNTIYDGGTQLGAIDLRQYRADEFLLFSDGHSTYGRNDLRISDKPINVITSSPASDLPYLQSVTQRSGGELINLDAGNPTDAVDQLMYQSLRFLGIKSSEDLGESYPSIPTPVVNGISVAGISNQPRGEIVLQFGYGSKIVMEKKITLDLAKQRTDQSDLSRIWAQKKIAELDRQYDDNKPMIEQLGKRYGLVTRNTSLIVLENVQDYITYAIEPPMELRDDYDRLMKQRETSLRQTRSVATDNAETYFNELLTWWRTDFKATPILKAKRNAGNEPLPDSVAVPLNGYAAGVVVADQSVVADQTPPSAQYSTAQLNEVVVTAVGTQKRRARVARTTSSGDMSVHAERMAKVDKEAFQGSTPGDEDPTGNGTFIAGSNNVSTDYLARIKAAPAKDQYATYLRLRKEQAAVPLFYFNVANYFLDAGNKETGLRILSNIAELDMENYELYKLLGYKLRQLGESEAAVQAFKKVLDWRPFEPQSYRDYGLALQDAGYYQQALDTLYTALTKNYDAMVNALYPGIEETLLPEINSLIAARADKINFSNIPAKLVKNMPVDLRVVLNWNMNDTDIDLWVTDPNGEKCYYSHRNTAIGGRISHDFTRGLGPEQFMLKHAVKGKYTVEVNYYGDRQMKIAGATTIMLEVFTGYGTQQQTRKIITMQMLPESKGTVFIGEFDFK
jgi:hypothetical protein